MNLFYLDNDLSTNARYHVDRHVGKMLMEAVQLLCTAFHLQGIEAPYRKTHQNHPSAIWARKSLDNLEWVIEYATKLGEEFTYRSDNVHASSLLLPFINENKHRLSFEESGITPFTLTMPDEFKTECPIQSYRSYYNVAKRHLHYWSRRETPPFITQ